MTAVVKKTLLVQGLTHGQLEAAVGSVVGLLAIDILDSSLKIVNDAGVAAAAAI